jgi:hypothetical protein
MSDSSLTPDVNEDYNIGIISFSISPGPWMKLGFTSVEAKNVMTGGDTKPSPKPSAGTGLEDKKSEGYDILNAPPNQMFAFYPSTPTKSTTENKEAAQKAADASSSISSFTGMEGELECVDIPDLVCGQWIDIMNIPIVSGKYRVFEINRTIGQGTPSTMRLSIKCGMNFMNSDDYKRLQKAGIVGDVIAITKG